MCVFTSARARTCFKSCIHSVVVTQTLQSSGLASYFAVLESFNTARDFLVISSTSWTPDEDITVLYRALMQVAERIGHGRGRIIALVTGKGPLRAKFEAMVQSHAFDAASSGRLSIFTGFVPAELYPVLLCTRKKKSPRLRADNNC